MTKQLRVLLADDDADDRYFFDKALRASTIPSDLTTVIDGEKLIDCLINNSTQLPDVIFLDLNMPRKNGAECLSEIKSNETLKHLPVIIYSTSLHNDVADTMYNNGAHYYLKKEGLTELELILHKILTSIKEKKFARPPRDQFILNTVSV